MLSITQVNDKVVYLKQRYVERDNRMQDILAVRKGNIDAVDPSMFPDGATKSMIANFIDIAARDISEVLAPLPSFNCAVSNMNNDRAKKKADKKTIIANHYVESSKLQSQMYYGADWYLSYGFLPIFVEADLETMIPRIRVENPLGAYPEFDRHGRVISFTKRYMKTMRELCVEFPEYESQIIGKGGRDSVDLNGQMELIRYEDKDQIMLFLPERMLPLMRMDNPIGEMMVCVARRPGIDPDDPRGQFDDVIYPQLARGRFAWLAMDAAEKSVNAPFVVPNDVQEFAFGPDAILRTSNPQGIRRVGLELPSGAFQEQAILEQELRMGARYPEGRSGTLDASIITGSGVQALLGGFDTQVKAAQEVFQELFQDVIGLCFKVDERLFAGMKKITGTQAGASYELEYEALKDISGDYSIQARYGLMAGLDPNRALIFALQALQADLVSHDFVMRELPWTMNVSQEQERIDVEKMRAALSGSFQALAQAIPQMASSGQDPSSIVNKMAQVIDSRRKGVMIEQAVMDAFKPEPAPEAPAGPSMSPEQLLSQMGGGQAPMPSPAAPPEAAMAMATAPPEEQGPPAGGGAPPDIASILAQMGG